MQACGCDVLLIERPCLRYDDGARTPSGCPQSNPGATGKRVARGLFAGIVRLFIRSRSRLCPLVHDDRQPSVGPPTPCASRSCRAARSCKERRLATVRLKPGHVQPVWAGHPWVYAQAIDRVEGGATRGDEVASSIRAATSSVAASTRRLCDPRAPARARRGDARSTRASSGTRFERALAARASIGLGGFGPRRPATASSTRRATASPGSSSIASATCSCVQFLTAGMKQREAMVLEALGAGLRAARDRRSDAARRAKAEGFTRRAASCAARRPSTIDFTERGITWSLPRDVGQKTGFYFDQRDLRARVEALVEAASASSTRTRTSARSASRGARRRDRGGVRRRERASRSRSRAETRARTASRGVTLRARRRARTMQEAHGEFDLTVVDPPRLAPTRGAREQALVMYAKLAELGCRATKPGGLVVAVLVLGGGRSLRADARARDRRRARERAATVVSSARSRASITRCPPRSPRGST